MKKRITTSDRYAPPHPSGWSRRKPFRGRGIMRLERLGVALVLAAGLAVLTGCVGENQAGPRSESQGPILKGGDDRTGEYEAVED